MPPIQHEVYFVAELFGGMLPVTDSPMLLFAPTSDPWNDFGFRTRFVYRLLSRAGDNQLTGEVHLAFVGDEGSSTDTVRAAVKSGEAVPASAFPPLFTMHVNMQKYRDLIRQLGPERGRDILLAMNDLVAIRYRESPPTWLGEATRSAPFTLAFMRASETFFAYHNAGSVLSGLEAETLTGMSTVLRLRFKLASFRNEHDLRFGFATGGPLPARVAVTIGKNGMGKSQTLGTLARSLLGDDDRLRDAEGARPHVHRLLAISSPGDASETFPAPNPLTDRVRYHRVSLRLTPAGGGFGVGDAIVQLARSEDTIGGASRWGIFVRALARLFPTDALFVRTSLSGQAPGGEDGPFADVPLKALREGGEQQRLERWARIDPASDLYRHARGERVPLSSGQLAFVRFAAQVCLHIENGTLLLCDEPETHLHPNLVTDFMALLEHLLDATGSLAILATHSAFVVREVPRPQVIVLRDAADGGVDVGVPRLRTLGADVGEISRFVFGDELFGRLVSKAKALLESDAENSTSLLGALEGELSAEAWMHLQRALAQDPPK